MKTNRDILRLIKKTGAIRKFKKYKIPNYLIDKIVDAGIWGPSVLAVQPWRYILISNKKIIEKIADICDTKAPTLPLVAEKILKLTSKVIKNSNFLIAVYNNEKLSKRVKKYGKKYIPYVRNAELLAIGASIQNMYLVSSFLGLGAVWLDSPCMFQNTLNKLIDSNMELIAFIAIGFPDMQPKRSKRNNDIRNIKFIK